MMKSGRSARHGQQASRAVLAASALMVPAFAVDLASTAAERDARRRTRRRRQPYPGKEYIIENYEKWEPDR